MAQLNKQKNKGNANRKHQLVGAVDSPSVVSDTEAVESPKSQGQESQKTEGRKPRPVNLDAIEFKRTKQMLDHLLETTQVMVTKVDEEQKDRDLAMGNDTKYTQAVNNTFQLIRDAKLGVKRLASKVADFNLDLAIRVKNKADSTFHNVEKELKIKPLGALERLPQEARMKKIQDKRDLEAVEFDLKQQVDDLQGQKDNERVVSETRLDLKQQEINDKTQACKDTHDATNKAACEQALAVMQSDLDRMLAERSD